MSRMMCDSSHDKLCNLSYRVIQGKGKFTAKTAQKKKEKKACVDTKILQKELQPNTLRDQKVTKHQA